jgi:dinuclear metal center YbgI/SA1388 family protein
VVSQQQLVTILHELLDSSRFNDYAPNGLQVEGIGEISRIATAVSASEDVIDAAINWKADALIVHHGYFWKGEASVITGIKRQRLSKLLYHNLNLLAYHLPLDCHLELGNNALLAKLWDVHSVKQHMVCGINNILWSGALATALTGDALSQLLTQTLGRKPLHLLGRVNSIQNIAWCSGAAQDYIEYAADLGVDAYLSGEVSERTYYQSRESGLHYFACGHHATERYGIQALGEYLTNNFQLEHLFIDSDNPI